MGQLHKTRKGQSLKGNTFRGIIAFPNQEFPNGKPANFPIAIKQPEKDPNTTIKQPEKDPNTTWLYGTRRVWPPISSGGAVPADRSTESSMNSPLREPPPRRKKQHAAYQIISQTRSVLSQTPSRHGNSQSGFRGPPRGGGRTPASRSLKLLVIWDLQFESQIAIAAKSCDLER